MSEKIKEISALIKALYLQEKTTEKMIGVLDIQAPLEGKSVKKGESLSKAIEFAKSEEFAKTLEKNFAEFSIEELRYMSSYYLSKTAQKFSELSGAQLYTELRKLFLV